MPEERLPDSPVEPGGAQSGRPLNATHERIKKIADLAYTGSRTNLRAAGFGYWRAQSGTFFQSLRRNEDWS